jgi:hypothetical protein
MPPDWLITRTVEGQQGDPPDPDLLNIRGISQVDEDVHSMISWTTRKDYPLMVGISLPIADQSFNGAHAPLLWEETGEELVITKNHAATLFTWLQKRFTNRSTHRFLPVGMPDSLAEVTVSAWKNGKAGYVLFTPSDMIADPISESETKIVIEYDSGYMREGVGNAYTIRMIYDDFMALTQNTWELYPALGYRRLVDGSIVHRCTTDYRTGRLLRGEDVPADQPVRILEDKGRRAEIHSTEDKGRLLQYWAWAQMPLDVGIMFPTKDNRTTEFWLEMRLQPEPDDGDPMMYLRIIKSIWMARLQKESPYVAAPLSGLGEDLSVKIRYLFNKIRLWYVPNSSLATGFTRSLAEEPCPKDKWHTSTDLMAFSVPPIPDGQIGNLPTLLFGPGRHAQERYDDPEVQGGKIALIAFKQIRVQKPPNSLHPMESTFLNQVAFNQRIIEAKNEISGINCDIADFVAGMSLDPAEEMIICVNGSEEMKRNEIAMAGQLWLQGDRKMAASNPPFEGMSNSKEAAVLSAVSEAVVWKNDALEVDGPRKGQRVVIYPKELTQLDAVLSSGDPNIDEEDGHPIAYQKVLAAAQSYERPPIFLREDCEQITSIPAKADLVPKWMCLAERIATGSRPRVLENGPDVWHSDDEAKEDVLPDVEKGMYTSGHKTHEKRDVTTKTIRSDY